jgi:perosamine synthetase
MIPISKPYIGEAEKQAVLEVLDLGMIAQGPRTAKFEEHFAQVCGVARGCHFVRHDRAAHRAACQ